MKRDLKGSCHAGAQDPRRPGQGRRTDRRVRWRHRHRDTGDHDRPPPAPAVAGARLLGLGSCQPDQVVTNDDLATAHGHQRRSGSATASASATGASPAKDLSLVDMAVEAGARAVKDAGLAPTDIDTVIVATCTMPNPIPNAAAQTAERIGIPAPAAFDLNAACAGFCYALGTAADLVRAGSARTCWSSAPRSSPTGSTGPTAPPRSSSPTAPVPRSSDRPPTPRPSGIGPVAWGSAGDLRQTRSSSRSETAALHQEGQAVFRWATTKIAPVALRAIELAGLTPADIDVLVPHQANLRIVEAIAKRLRKAWRPRGHGRGRRHRALRQHLVGVDPAGAGPHARRRAGSAPATPCCSSGSAPACPTPGRSSSVP